MSYSTRFIAECVSGDHFQLFGLSSLLWSPDPALLFVGTPSAERHIGERNGPNVIFFNFLRVVSNGEAVESCVQLFVANSR